MTGLSVSLLGTIQVQHGLQPVPRHAYVKVFALLAYLAVEADRPHARATLATLLWPDQPDERARHSLRQALSTLRRLLETGDTTEIVLAHRDTLQLNPDAPIAIDIRLLLTLLDTCDQHPHPRIDRCPSCAQRITQAAALVRGEFLDGFSVDDSPAFDDWVFVWRERLQRRILPALGHLASWHRQRGALDAAAEVLKRQLELDPWLEDAHRELMDVLWHQGNRTAALAQYERCRQVLDEELGVEPDDATAALYERIAASAAPPTARPDLEPQSGQLPAPVGRLVGRDRERQEIADLLARHDCRLLTLVGPGGIGKTRLAIQLAHDARDHGLGDTWFIPLEPVRKPAAVIQAIASEVGISMSAASNMLRELRAWLRDRTVVLFLDNVEHLLNDMDVLIGLLDAAPGLTLLLTSRERLNLRGEWVYELQGLAVAPPNAENAGNSDAVAMFEDRLRQVRPRTPLQPAERPTVATICRMVEGMPLAIELAAAWAQTLTIEEIASHIGESIDFLSTSFRDVPERHRSMRAVFAQTWQLLSPEEQVAYRRLSLFQHGFTRLAAEQVTGTSAGQLAALVGKSLLVQDPPGRYRLHGLLAQYARELLVRDDTDVDGLNERHARFYLQWLAGQERALTGHDQRDLLDQIETDDGNLRVAWLWAIRHQDTALLLGAIQPFWLYLAIRGRMLEGAAIFRSLVDAMDVAEDRDAAHSPERILVRAAALARTGGFESGLGHYDEGIRLLDDALPVLKSLGATREVGLCLNMLAAACRMTGDLDRAISALEQSLEAFRAIGDRWGIGYSLNDLGLMLHLKGESDIAEHHCEQGWVLLRQLGDRRGAAFASFNLGMIASHRGDHDRARYLYRESLALREAGHDQWGIGSSLVQLASETQALGDMDEARELYIAALRIGRNSSITPLVLEALVGIAALFLATGQAEGADAVLVPVATHPATPDHLRAQIETLRPGLDRGSGEPLAGMPAPAWAIQTIDDLARTLVDTPDLALHP